MMGTQLLSSRRCRLFVLVLVLLGFVVVSGASELPCLASADDAKTERVGWETAAGAPTLVELRMIRLIRRFFGDQVKWSPFLACDHIVHATHHRIVHEDRPHDANLHDELANCKRRFHLRGQPGATTSEVTSQLTSAAARTTIQ